MVSSLRNSLHRRTHKERAQPVERQKLGLLEKKKDYAARAANYHSKKERIEALRRKAGDRNKDEFYFGMHNSKTEVSKYTFFVTEIMIDWSCYDREVYMLNTARTRRYPRRSRLC